MRIISIVGVPDDGSFIGRTGVEGHLDQSAANRIGNGQNRMGNECSIGGDVVKLAHGFGGSADGCADLFAVQHVVNGRSACLDDQITSRADGEWLGIEPIRVAACKVVVD